MERRLVILGSGELAPPMVKTYRHLFDGLDARRGVYLDTPFGFQENVPQLSEKIEQYFATSLQWEFRRASWTDDNQESPRARAAFLNALHDASVIFAGRSTCGNRNDSEKVRFIDFASAVVSHSP